LVRVGIAHVPVAFAFICVVSRSAGATSSADELVRQARAHEEAHEEDLAVRRYTEALSLETTNQEAWIGLGELRMKLGETAEAERVYDAALTRVPSLRRALRGRAFARWSLGRHKQAEADLEAYAEAEQDTIAYRQLSDWLAVDGRTPAQLALWRRLLAAAVRASDAGVLSECGRMVRALVVLVDGADPASSPIDPDMTRRSLATIARRGR
jgi:tetratricopeptide (TPR) repeat protein